MDTITDSKRITVSEMESVSEFMQKMTAKEAVKRKLIPRCLSLEDKLKGIPIECILVHAIELTDGYRNSFVLTNYKNVYKKNKLGKLVPEKQEVVPKYLWAMYKKTKKFDRIRMVTQELFQTMKLNSTTYDDAIAQITQYENDGIPCVNQLMFYFEQ